MTIKRLSKKKLSKTKEEKKELTDSFINSGGKTTKESVEENIEKQDFRFTLRIPSTVILQIDRKRKQKVGRFSRNNWILEAIEEKLKSN